MYLIQLGVNYIELAANKNDTLTGDYMEKEKVRRFVHLIYKHSEVVGQFKSSLVEYIKYIKHTLFPSTNNKFLEVSDYTIHIYI